VRRSARRSERMVRRRLASNQASDRSTFHRWRPSLVLDSIPRRAILGGDPSLPQQLPADRIVVARITMQLGWALARPTGPAPRPDDRRHGVHHGLKQLRIVGVGGRHPNRQREAAAVDQQVVFGPWLAAIDRVCANEVPPRRARTLTESMAARDQSTWPSSPSQSSSR
jgi:hypothetical protein